MKNIFSLKMIVDYKTLLIKIFLFMLIFVPLYLFKNTLIRAVGMLSILVMFLVILFDVLYRINGKNRIKLNTTWIWFLALGLYYFVMLARTPSARGVYAYVLQMILLLLITVATTVTLDNDLLKKVFNTGKVIFFILLIPASIIALQGGRTAFRRFDILYNPVIYKVMLPCTFFFIAGSKYKLLKILIFSLMYLRMVERTSAIVLVIIFIVYLVLKKVKIPKSLYRIIFFGIIISLVGFVYGYVELQSSELGRTINILFRQYTGGNFYSGRNTIWRTAFEFIKASPIFGYGIDNGIMKAAGVMLSTHNTYIQILLQGGIVGLSLFSMFMYSIWKRLFFCLKDDIVMTSVAYLVGILIFINFEVTLIGNSVVTSIFLWLVVGVGVMRCNYIKREYKALETGD